MVAKCAALCFLALQLRKSVFDVFVCKYKILEYELISPWKEVGLQDCIYASTRTVSEWVMNVIIKN